MECEGVNKGVQFHGYGTIPSPHTDGRTIHLYEPNGMWTDDQWDDWEYECQHEIGHESAENCDPHWKTVIKEKKVLPGSALAFLWNLMSDHVQEHNRIGKYRGRDRILKKGRARFVNDRLIREVDKQRETKEGSILKVACIYDTLCRQDWNEWLRGVADAVVPDLPAVEADMYNTLLKADIRIQDGKNEYDAYNFALEILKALGEDPKDHGEGQGGGAGKGEGDGAEQAGSPGKEGEPGEGEGKEGKEGVSSKAKAEMEGVLQHTHYDKPTPKGYKSPTDGQHIEYDDSVVGAGSDGFVPNSFEEIVFKNGDTGPRNDSHRIRSSEDLIESVQGGKLLAAQVKKLLISMKQARWQHGERRGTISNKNLWKGKGPIYDDRVFKHRTSKIEINTAVTVLTDNSGSMAGDKFAHAARAGIMLSEAMQKVGVPVELLSFSEGASGPFHAVVKGFNERIGHEHILVNRYAQCSQWMAQNSDGESIQWAYNRLYKRPEKRKVLIVLSDGSPAAYNGTHGAEYGYTQMVIKNIEENTPVEIYGIGIMDNNVERLYKEHKVLNNSSELENMLLGLVKQKVLK
jgi:hypothetical protein